MRVSIEEIVKVAIDEGQKEVEKRYKEMSAGIGYKQEMHYDPSCNRVAVADIYTIPAEIIEKCYGMPITEMILKGVII